MARKSTNNPRPKRRRAAETRRGRPKPCAFCKQKVDHIDWKDASVLRKYMSDRGKIRGRRVNGNCPTHQRAVANAIKNAREMALLPYLNTR
jgi:small subunit ribosomal protein S18